MLKNLGLLAVASVLILLGTAVAQQAPQQTQPSSASSYPLLDTLAAKVIQKYETSTCVQLATEKSQKPTGQKAVLEQRAIEVLKNDPKMRKAFIDKVAAPIANKLFECGMIP